MKKALFIGLLLQVSSVSAEAFPQDFTKDFTPQVYGAYSQWYKEGTVNYGYDFKRSCYCQDSGTVYRITVINNKVVSAFNVDTDVEVEDNYLASFKTIEMLFSELMQANNTAHIINSSFDYEYGYPKSVFIDMDPRMADEEISYTIEGMYPILF
ncbi:hypothetical protein HQQ94_04160 [Shewanella sp. VB17]|uniref:DUF6174 domain-containing protein n=1 Tax=Shewanella sp. VB17 TaxID=2739432 RepID=UPI001565AFCE|nr:DUF6174 domain-containing protein [Shewanella sp. VB17]NRD72452.1 hypothetical protein [Shewanella sp. VB17]